MEQEKAEVVVDRWKWRGEIEVETVDWIVENARETAVEGQRFV